MRVMPLLRMNKEHSFVHARSFRVKMHAAAAISKTWMRLGWRKRPLVVCAAAMSTAFVTNYVVARTSRTFRTEGNERPPLDEQLEREILEQNNAQWEKKPEKEQGFFESWFSFMKPDRSALLPPESIDQFGRRPRTLVLSWEQVLVVSKFTREHGWRVQVRDDAQNLLQRAFQGGWEIVLWANKPSYEIDGYLAMFDTQSLVRNRLYYEHFNMKGMKSIKDLNRLGRDLRRVVVVDVDPKFYIDQPDNALLIKPFDGDVNDHNLTKLADILDKIVKYNVHDVRPLIHQYNQNPSQNLFATHEALIRQSRQALTGSKSSDARANQSTSGSAPVWNFFRSFFNTKTVQR